MRSYRCYFLGRDDKRLVVEEISALSDHDALERARDRFAVFASFPVFELWSEDQLIHRQQRNPAPA